MNQPSNLSLTRRLCRDGDTRAVTTEDFIAVAESVSGRELDELFQAWLYDDVMPDLP